MLTRGYRIIQKDWILFVLLYYLSFCFICTLTYFNGWLDVDRNSQVGELTLHHLMFGSWTQNSFLMEINSVSWRELSVTVPVSLDGQQKLNPQIIQEVILSVYVLGNLIAKSSMFCTFCLSQMYGNIHLWYLVFCCHYDDADGSTNGVCAS